MPHISYFYEIYVIAVWHFDSNLLLFDILTPPFIFLSLSL